MFNRRAFVASTAAALLPISAQALTGAAAPAFVGQGSKGERVSLADYAGRMVVLEWTNHDCPFVVAQYNAGAMQALQREAALNNVAWIQVISSAPGTQGHVDGPAADRIAAERGAVVTHTVLDPSGTIGRAYGAATTPQMAVIDPTGALRYWGAIDDGPNWEQGAIRNARNHVRAALSDLVQGRPVGLPQTRPYGCSVKYS